MEETYNSLHYSVAPLQTKGNANIIGFHRSRRFSNRIILWLYSWTQYYNSLTQTNFHAPTPPKRCRTINTNTSNSSDYLTPFSSHIYPAHDSPLALSEALHISPHTACEKLRRNLPPQTLFRLPHPYCCISICQPPEKRKCPQRIFVPYANQLTFFWPRSIKFVTYSRNWSATTACAPMFQPTYKTFNTTSTTMISQCHATQSNNSFYSPSPTCYDFFKLSDQSSWFLTTIYFTCNHYGPTFDADRTMPVIGRIEIVFPNTIDLHVCSA